MWNWLRHYPIMQALRAERSWLYMHHESFSKMRVQQINGDTTRAVPYIVAAAEDDLRFIPLRKNLPPFTFTPDDIRWFGRPQKYSNGNNEMWIHVEKKDGWFILKMTLSRGHMTKWVRVMKSVCTEALITAYRRRRPYIHYGPLDVHPAAQDLYGAWTLEPSVTVYVMPLHVVLLNGLRVIRVIPLERIQMIRAGRRFDAADGDGLVQFMIGDEKLAFAGQKFQPLADALAEAAKRSLEAPLMQKSKAKEDE